MGPKWVQTKSSKTREVIILETCSPRLKDSTIEKTHKNELRLRLNLKKNLFKAFRQISQKSIWKINNKEYFLMIYSMEINKIRVWSLP